MSEVKNNQVGRPRATINSLPPDWESIMMDLAQAGEGSTAWRVYLGISRKVFEHLLNEDIYFSEAVEKAEDLYRLWWERQAMRMVLGGQGNASVYAIVMNNKFGYRTMRGDSQNSLPKTAVDPTIVKEVKSLSKEELEKELKRRGLPTQIFVESREN